MDLPPSYTSGVNTTVTSTAGASMTVTVTVTGTAAAKGGGSDTTKVGLGAGLGVGLPLTVALIAALAFLWRAQKKIKRLESQGGGGLPHHNHHYGVPELMPRETKPRGEADSNHIFEAPTGSTK